MSVGSAEKLIVFEKAYELALEVHHLSQDFPKTEQYGGVAEQMRRASKSICANLVEGAGRQGLGSKAEFRRFAVMALGSSEEVRLRLRFARDLGYASPESASDLSGRYEEISKMLAGLIKNLGPPRGGA